MIDCVTRPFHPITMPCRLETHASAGLLPSFAWPGCPASLDHIRIEQFIPAPYFVINYDIEI
jgi:hypothetical protein